MIELAFWIAAIAIVGVPVWFMFFSRTARRSYRKAHAADLAPRPAPIAVPRKGDGFAAMTGALLAPVWLCALAAFLIACAWIAIKAFLFLLTF